MIELRGVHKAFGDHHVLRGVSLTLPSQQLIGLIGPSGSGKSVLLKLIAGIDRVDAGAIVDPKTPLTRALMFQEGALFDSLTVLDNVAFPLVDGRVPIALLDRSQLEEVFQRAIEALRRVGLAAAAYKFPAQLSGGMRRRVSLARALVARPGLLLLDDPTSGLDPVSGSVIMDLIAELHREYLPTTLIVSQDLRRLLPLVEHVFALVDGVITYSGSVASMARDADPLLVRFVRCRYDFPEPPR